MRKACLGDSLYVGGSSSPESGFCDNLGSVHGGRAKAHGRMGREPGNPGSVFLICFQMSRPRIIHTKCGDRTEGFDLLKPQKYITCCPRDL